MKFLFVLFFAAMSFLATIFWIWCIIDIIRGQFKSDTDKIVWLVLVLALPFLGTILYIGLGRQNRQDRFEEYV
jgi:hypothetical protein